MNNYAPTWMRVVALACLVFGLTSFLVYAKTNDMFWSMIVLVAGAAQVMLFMAIVDHNRASVHSAVLIITGKTSSQLREELRSRHSRSGQRGLS